MSITRRADKYFRTAREMQAIARTDTKRLHDKPFIVNNHTHRDADPPSYGGYFNTEVLSKKKQRKLGGRQEERCLRPSTAPPKNHFVAWSHLQDHERKQRWTLTKPNRPGTAVQCDAETFQSAYKVPNKWHHGSKASKYVRQPTFSVGTAAGASSTFDCIVALEMEKQTAVRRSMRKAARRGQSANAARAPWNPSTSIPKAPTHREFLDEAKGQMRRGVLRRPQVVERSLCASY